MVGFNKIELFEFFCKSCGKKQKMKTYNNCFCDSVCRDNFFNRQKREAMMLYRNAMREQVI